METVHIAGRVDRLQRSAGGNLGGQRRLHENAAHGLVGVQPPDQLDHLLGAGGFGQPVIGGRDADLLGVSMLVADVGFRSGMLADQDDREVRTRTPIGDPALHPLADLLQDGGGGALAVERDQSPTSRRAASAASLITVARSPPSRRQSSYSGATSTGLPSSSLTLTRTRPRPVSTSIVRRPAISRLAGVIRTPRLVPRARTSLASSSARPGSASTESCWPGRPFFMRTGASVTSRAPAASRSSMSGASRFGAMSSRLASITVTVAASSTARPSQTAAAFPGCGRAPSP